jgi:hypothetical protein
MPRHAVDLGIIRIKVDRMDYDSFHEFKLDVLALADTFKRRVRIDIVCIKDI